MIEFKEWPKIPRGQNETITITEKIDGTNACVIVQPVKVDNNDGSTSITLAVVGAQSRNQLLAHNNFDNELRIYHDNYGFAEWVMRNQELLVGLGEGYHYGEWAGPGIQKNPLGLTEKKFFLFNTFRWDASQNVNEAPSNRKPPVCCDVVPVLYNGRYTDTIIQEYMNDLRQIRHYEPEGVVVWYHHSRRYEKYTYKYAEGKWKSEADEDNFHIKVDC